MKPSIPKGTRDFSPTEMIRKNYIFDAIKSVYQRYGFQQIETPAMENLSTLEGKYGEEGDKLLFRILNSGPVLEQFQTSNLKPQTKDIAEKGLRYDLTVPFARYVVMHQNEITFPFKRFQMQPVWRADRPQKGRYREFYQCDADIIGSDSLLNEVELIQIIDDVFSQLQVDVIIKINNRKVLQGIAEYCGCPDKLIDITTAIDKYDKIGLAGIIEDLKQKGFDQDKLDIILSCIFPSENDYVFYSKEELIGFGYSEKEAEVEFNLQESTYRTDFGKINCLDDNFRELDIEQKENIGLLGVNEIKFLFDSFDVIKLKHVKLEFDPTLARGLNYYTGAIIEVKVNDRRSQFTSSICGGGRYDDLTGIFGLPNVSGVGISFGADRIYDVLEEIGGFPDFGGVSTKILFVNFGEEEAKHCMKLVKRLREGGINTELYPDVAKMKKQMSYADAKKIPYVALIGSEEVKTGEITIKNMSSGEQSKVTMEKLLDLLK